MRIALGREFKYEQSVSVRGDVDRAFFNIICKFTMYATKANKFEGKFYAH
jgi:hypothetical protein